MDALAESTVFSVSASGASWDLDLIFRVRWGGRLEASFLAGTGVVGRGSPPDPPDPAYPPEPLNGRLVSELDFKLFNRITSPPVTFGETALAKLQLDMS